MHQRLSEQDDQDDENAFIDLLRRSAEAQVRTDLAFHKDSRSLYFRAFAPGRPRRYDYPALTNNTSADVVSIHEKAGREAVMRHHAFNPRYQRLGDDWFVSITPTFVFTVCRFANKWGHIQFRCMPGDQSGNYTEKRYAAR